MKITKNLMLFVVTMLVATFTFTSCLNDDDVKVPTAEEQAGYQRTMAGRYGSVARFYYFNYNNQVKYDSLKNYSWDVTADSTITMNNFPVCKLDSAINVRNNNDNATAKEKELAALRTAIHESTATTKFQAKYFIPNESFFVEYGYSFLVYPLTIKQNFIYNGQSHDVYFIFDTSGYYGGTFVSSTITGKVLEYKMVLAGICIDNYNYDSLVSTQYFRQVVISCTTK